MGVHAVSTVGVQVKRLGQLFNSLDPSPFRIVANRNGVDLRRDGGLECPQRGSVVSDELYLECAGSLQGICDQTAMFSAFEQSPRFVVIDTRSYG